MTCIVGVIEGSAIFMGGDSAGVNGLWLDVRRDEKVFINSGFLFGFTSSFRMGQVLRYGFTPPKRYPDKDLMAYMVTDFVDAVRTSLKAAGFAHKENDVESAGQFLIGHAGRLFMIDNDYQVAESRHPYQAVGCGAEIASGAMYASQGKSAVERINLALSAAERHSAGVRGPFTVLSI
ncbi:MAG: hypothetical protein EPN62_00860 [Candidimonas sp.]|nr:MAG: hypothetical protein EPN77_01860 [Candidimonas sp.]TAM26879.1 MAG: hypothetical protein EPN62_00860 [Candidimonas sp.]